MTQIISKNKLLILLLVGIFIIKLVTLISFNNVEWEPDSYMHFLELRTVYADFPNNLDLGLNVWSKPLYIYPLGLLVQIFNTESFLLTQIVNVLIFLLTALLVYKIVLKLYGNFLTAILSLILTSFSLTLFKSSVSVLTEPIFTLLLVLSFYFLTKRKFLLSSLIMGLCVLARIEGLFFIGLHFLYLVHEFKFNIRKVIFSGILLGLPLFVWNFVGFLSTGNILYFRTFFQSYSSGNYGVGSLLDYPKLFITKEFILSLLFVAAIFIFIKFNKKFKNKKLIIYSFVIFTGFVFIQAILWSRGALGTAGLIRYFISVIPFMVIFIASFFKIISLYLNQKIFLFTIITVTFSQILLLALYLSGTIVNTKEFPKVESSLILAGEWAKNNVEQFEFLAADRPEILYYAQRDLTNSKVYFGEDFRNRKSGIYIWTEWSPITNKIERMQLEAEGELLIQFNNQVFVYEIK